MNVGWKWSLLEKRDGGRGVGRGRLRWETGADGTGPPTLKLIKGHGNWRHRL